MFSNGLSYRVFSSAIICRVIGMSGRSRVSIVQRRPSVATVGSISDRFVNNLSCNWNEWKFSRVSSTVATVVASSTDPSLKFSRPDRRRSFPTLLGFCRPAVHVRVFHAGGLDDMWLWEWATFYVSASRSRFRTSAAAWSRFSTFVTDGRCDA